MVDILLGRRSSLTILMEVAVGNLRFLALEQNWFKVFGTAISRIPGQVIDELANSDASASEYDGNDIVILNPEDFDCFDAALMSRKHCKEWNRMSDDLNQQAIALMKAQRFADALTLIRTQIEQNPHWSSLYMAGQCCRYLDDLDNAVIYLRRAISFEAGEPAVFLALGIALQLTNRLIDAIEAFRQAIEIDPDYELAYNSLALTQKKQGELDLALHNYEAGAHALSRRIVKSFRNDRCNTILKHKTCQHQLWIEHAMYAGMYLCSLDDRIQGMSWPTGQQAEEEETTEKHEGLYWVDRRDSENKFTRLFLPNYFNTFRETLRLDRAYSDLIGNRGTVLEQMGRYDEARKHFDEARFFIPQT